MNRQYLYAVLFENNVVKLGRTSSAKSRIIQLRSVFGHEVTKAFAFECNSWNVTKLEQQLLLWADSVSNRHEFGREFFVGLNFEDALSKIWQITGNSKGVEIVIGDSKPKRQKGTSTPKKRVDIEFLEAGLHVTYLKTGFKYVIPWRIFESYVMKKFFKGLT